MNFVLNDAIVLLSITATTHDSSGVEQRSSVIAVQKHCVSKL